MQTETRTNIYDEITNKIIGQIEAGILPWVQPWKGGLGIRLPKNAHTGNAYSGINILLLWDWLYKQGFEQNTWLTFKQALALGGAVRKGERGTVGVYADSFIPQKERETKTSEEEMHHISFLKRFTLFNVAQCEGLPEKVFELLAPVSESDPYSAAELLLAASGAKIERGGEHAYYHIGDDAIRIPDQVQFYVPINFYRTALHELTHWTGHTSRLNRDFSGRFGSEAYAREELVAELGSAFLCAELGIVPTVRHADYIGNWLNILKNDNRAIISAASLASKASNYVMAFGKEGSG